MLSSMWSRLPSQPLWLEQSVASDVPALTVSGLGRSAAFDKGDLLYLRDEEEKRRFKETELRDSERIRFQALRAGVDSHRDPPGPAPAPAPPPGNPAGAPSSLLRDPPKPTRCVNIESPPTSDLHMSMLQMVLKPSWTCSSSLFLVLPLGILVRPHA